MLTTVQVGIEGHITYRHGEDEVFFDEKLPHQAIDFSPTTILGRSSFSKTSELHLKQIYYSCPCTVDTRLLKTVPLQTLT